MSAEASRRYRRSEKGRAAARAYEQSPRGRCVRAQRYAKYRTSALGRMKRLARSRVAYAVKMGRLVPLPCEMCGAAGAQAHHPFGYEAENAYAVWWLCRPHHYAMHRHRDIWRDD